jgi:hypothetical protein
VFLATPLGLAVWVEAVPDAVAVVDVDIAGVDVAGVEAPGLLPFATCRHISIYLCRQKHTV